MRLSLLNGQDQVLMQSDGQSPANPGPQIAIDVPAGPDYLEVENLGGARAYTVTAALTPANAPFQPISVPTVVSRNGIVAGEFTGDGHTDLAVVNPGANDVSVLLGNGDGTFQPPVNYAAGTDPHSVVAGDFNGDGHTDLAVTSNGSVDASTGTYIPGTGSVSVLLGNGDGTFQPPVTYAAGDGAGALVAGDFTGDGHIDLAVADQGYSGYDSSDGSYDLPVPGSVSVLLGNSDGTFQPPGGLRGGALTSRHRGGRLHLRRSDRPGRCQLQHQ
jgi:hypothetical protein